MIYHIGLDGSFGSAFREWTSIIEQTNKAQIPLRRLCDFHRNFPAGKVADTNHESLRHKSWRRLSWFASADFVTDFVANISTCRDNFVSATFMICVHDFPLGEVSAKVGIMEFGLNQLPRR